MTWQDALSALAGHHHITRYRELCAETWPDHLAYREFVVRLATGEPEPIIIPPPAPMQFQPQINAYVWPPDPWLPLIRACDAHNPGCCTHPAAFCSRFAKDVSREQCIDCLTADGITP